MNNNYNKNLNYNSNFFQRQTPNRILTFLIVKKNKNNKNKKFLMKAKILANNKINTQNLLISNFLEKSFHNI